LGWDGMGWDGMGWDGLVLFRPCMRMGRLVNIYMRIRDIYILTQQEGSFRSWRATNRLHLQVL